MRALLTCACGASLPAAAGAAQRASSSALRTARTRARALPQPCPWSWSCRRRRSWAAGPRLRGAEASGIVSRWYCSPCGAARAPFGAAAGGGATATGAFTARLPLRVPEGAGGGAAVRADVLGSSAMADAPSARTFRRRRRRLLGGLRYLRGGLRRGLACARVQGRTASRPRCAGQRKSRTCGLLRSRRRPRRRRSHKRGRGRNLGGASRLGRRCSSAAAKTRGSANVAQPFAARRAYALA